MRVARLRPFLIPAACAALAGPAGCERLDGEPSNGDADMDASGSSDSAGSGGTNGGGSGGTGAGGRNDAPGGSGADGRGGGCAGAAGGAASGGSTGAGGTAGVSGAGGSTGGQDGGNCYTGTAPPPSFRIVGSSFDAWEGEPVDGCLLPTQSFPSSCSRTVVRCGGFSLTGAVCTADRWDITVGSMGHQVRCAGWGALTPVNCWCSSGNGPDPGAAGGPGVGCDAGTKDASANAPAGVE